MEVPHNFSELIQCLFYAVICLLGTSTKNELKSLRKSAEQLNIRMGALIEKSSWHEKEIKRLDKQKVDKKVF